MASTEIFDSEKLLALLEADDADRDVLASAPAILNAVYLCSLYKEEGRELHCRLIVAVDLKADSDFDILRLTHPIPLSALALRRLSPATTESASAFVIDASGNVPHIVGLGCLTSVSHLLRALGCGGSPVYEVACRGPGIVEISLKGRSARFTRDRYTRRNLWLAASATLRETAVDALVNRVIYPGIEGWIGYSMGHSVGVTDPGLFALHKPTMQAESPTFARTALAAYTADLVDSIRATGAGGAVLILPGSDAPEVLQNITGTPVMRAHKRYRGELWNAGVLNAFEWMVHMRMAHLGKVVAPKEVKPIEEWMISPPDPNHWIHSVGIPGFGQALEIQANDAKRVAQLTAIDGAVVMNNLLSPVMFGAKFATVDVAHLPIAIQATVAERGMRHRSMAATVGALGDSSGIVVSQDGDVTVFVNHAGSICYHREDDDPLALPEQACVHTSSPRVPKSEDLLIAILQEEERARQRTPGQS